MQISTIGTNISIATVEDDLRWALVNHAAPNGLYFSYTSIASTQRRKRRPATHCLTKVSCRWRIFIALRHVLPDKYASSGGYYPAPSVAVPV